MRNRWAFAILFAILTPLSLPGAPEAAGGVEAERFWPQWRGPLMTGVAPHATPPLEWSETKNVRWKVEIPGKGSSTPVVWGDRIFVLSAVPTGEPKPIPATASLPQRPAPAPPAASSADASAAPSTAAAAPSSTGQAPAGGGPGAPPPGGPRPGGGPPRNILPERVQQFTILAIGRADGKLLWKRVLREEQPHEGTHATGSWAASSAATDGENIRASPAISWKLDRDTPYVPSPLLYGDELYILKGNNGLLSCLDAGTGERLYGPERLEGVPNVYASPVGAAGRVYIAGREGTTAVVERGRAFKLLRTNTLEDGFDASPVAVGSELYLRGQKFLYRISE